MYTRWFLSAFLAAGLLSGQVTYDRILHADREPQNWLTYSGGYAGNRYSPAFADQPRQREESANEVGVPPHSI